MLLTAGRTSPEVTARALQGSAKSLRNIGAKTYVIAIGKEPDKTKLLPTVQDPKDIFRIQTYDLLPVELPTTARQISDRTGQCALSTFLAQSFDDCQKLTLWTYGVDLRAVVGQIFFQNSQFFNLFLCFLFFP